MQVPYVLRRPWLLARGALVDRGRPDLDYLRSIQDPMRFVWAMLPHAARSFATSIIMLPEEQSRTAAVAYLYCRMLDTYEDLAGPADRIDALRGFAQRMSSLDPPPRVELVPRDERDNAFVQVIDRCELVDQVFESLSSADQKRIVALVQAMAEGMVWSSQKFEEQGGVLVDMGQVRRYCHHVIGEPVLFALDLVAGSYVVVREGDLRDDAMAVSELIQIANITRDVERDLARGIAYHPTLLDYLGKPESVRAVAAARRHLLVEAMPKVSAFARLWDAIPTRAVSPARASAVLMLLHTDRHYQTHVRLVGHPGWRSFGSVTMFAAAALAIVSRRWSRRLIDRVERDLLAAAELLAKDPKFHPTPEALGEPGRQ